MYLIETKRAKANMRRYGWDVPRSSDIEYDKGAARDEFRLYDIMGQLIDYELGVPEDEKLKELKLELEAIIEDYGLNAGETCYAVWYTLKNGDRGYVIMEGWSMAQVEDDFWLSISDELLKELDVDEQLIVM